MIIDERAAAETGAAIDSRWSVKGDSTVNIRVTERILGNGGRRSFLDHDPIREEGGGACMGSSHLRLDRILRI